MDICSIYRTESKTEKRKKEKNKNRHSSEEMVHVIVHGHAVSPEEGFVKQVGLELSIKTQSSICYKSLAFPTNCIKY